MIRTEDIAIWEAAKPFLDVRKNDEHTLHSYVIGQQLLKMESRANPNIVLPAIILHDTGWKRIPQDKILQAFGPERKYPELQRQHEIEGVEIATKILTELNYDASIIKQITDIIDGHDTNKEERSINDGIMKDADKLWRFTAHGISIIPRWFEISNDAFFEMLESYVMPQIFRSDSLLLAKSLLNIARLNERMPIYIN